MGETLYEYAATEELKLRKKLVDYLKNGNKEEYERYIESIPALRSALKACKHGFKYKLAFDKRNGKYKMIPKKTEKYSIGKTLFDFINSTGTVIVFTKGFSEKADTFVGDGCTVNGLWEKGEMVAFGEGEKYKRRMILPTCLARKVKHSKHKQVCGMRCRYFDKYGYCDNPVHTPPCHLWRKHLETFTKPIKAQN